MTPLYLTEQELEAMVLEKTLRTRDKAVRLLQYGVREGSEAKEAGVVAFSFSSKLQ